MPPEAIELLRLYLKGHQLVPAAEAFDVIASLHHGHVEAVLLTMRRLGFASLLASRSSRARELVLALVAARILEPESKLATTRSWHVTSLPTTLGVADADADELYAAMDWSCSARIALNRSWQPATCTTTAWLYTTLSSSYFEGLRCPLASRGHNRDGKKGKLQVNYGLLTNERGLPVSVSVFKGNTADPTTLLPEVEKMRSDFGMQRIVLVGDRGMITQKQVDALREIDGIDWIAALRPEAIKKLIPAGQVQMRLFDERNLFELTHADFPGERLVACRNPELARRRAEKRQSLLEATGGELGRVRGMVERGRLRGQEQIGKAVQRVLNQYKIGKCYRVEIRDDGFDVQVDPDQLTAEQARDARVPPKLAQARQQRRQRHRRAIDEQLGKIRQRIGRGQLHGKDEIGVRVGKVVNKYKVGKHFKLDIQDDGFDFELDPGKVAAEAALDGIYVVRTSLAKQVMSAADAVRSYKLLSQVERAFRSFKTLDLEVRPIYHHLERRVRAHIFLCLLAYYAMAHAGGLASAPVLRRRPRSQNHA